MYNKVLLIGNLTRDPELRYTPSGLPIARFTVAVNRPKKKGAEKNDVDFINVTAWRRLAEICGEYLKKGMPVAVEGRLSIRAYVTKTGEKRIAVEVVADNMQMLGRKQDSPSPSPAQETEKESADNEEVPF